MRQSQERRALRQFIFSTGKSAWVRIAIVSGFLLTLLFLFDSVFFEDKYEFLGILSVKIKSLLLGRGIHFFLGRLGWCAGGLFLAIIFALFDAEAEGSNMMAPSGSSGPSGRPTFDLNLPPDDGGEKGENVQEIICQRRCEERLAIIHQEKLVLAAKMSPLIEEESRRLNFNRELLPSETDTAMVDTIIRRMGSALAQKANEQAEAPYSDQRLKELKALRGWLTRACQNADDETQGQMSLRTEIRHIMKEYIH